MTLIYENTTLAASQPKTHALVIGVGEYPHLKNGSAFKNAPATVLTGLGQLTSSVVSAKEFAAWLVSDLDNPKAPLATVELLLSPAGPFTPPGGATAQVEAADMKNVKDAFNRWYARCDTDAGNVAVFYFCGHGVEYDKTILFPEDFGSDPNTPWDTSIDFNKTFYGMGECKAQTQCYFLDACREAAFDALKSLGVSPRPLKTTSLTVFQPRAAPILKAAIPGKKAYGPANGVSYFTEELLRCMKGLGADNKVGKVWHVTPESITKAMVHVMSKRNLHCGKGGEYNVSSVLHTIPDPARSYAEVRCNPLAALQSASLELRKSGVQYTRGPAAGPWEEEVETGIYDVEVTFPAGATYTATVSSGEIVYPPYYECELEV